MPWANFLLGIIFFVTTSGSIAEQIINVCITKPNTNTNTKKEQRGLFIGSVEDHNGFWFFTFDDVWFILFYAVAMLSDSPTKSTRQDSPSIYNPIMVCSLTPTSLGFP